MSKERKDAYRKGHYIRTVQPISMPPDLKDLLPVIAAAKGKPIAAIVRTALYETYRLEFPQLEAIVGRVGSEKFFQGQ